MSEYQYHDENYDEEGRQKGWSSVKLDTEHLKRTLNDFFDEKAKEIDEDQKPFCDMKGKLRLDLVPPELEEAFAEVAEFGLIKLKKHKVKNPENNWLVGLRLDGDHITKARRHIAEWRSGLDFDHESGLNPLQHALWHLGAAITQIKRNRKDLDDRTFKKTKKD